MNQKLFVTRMKEARERKKMTFKELADACGVSASAMNRYSIYGAQPGVEVVWQMAKVLGVSMDWLCGQEENHQPPSMGLVLRMLSILLTTETKDGLSTWIADFDDDGGSKPRIIITQQNVNNAIDFRQWQTIIELCKVHAIDKEMYVAWIEKKIRDASHIELPMGEEETDHDEP